MKQAKKQKDELDKVSQKIKDLTKQAEEAKQLKVQLATESERAAKLEKKCCRRKRKS